MSTTAADEDLAEALGGYAAQLRTRSLVLPLSVEFRDVTVTNV
jgi:hypothetical protein